MDGRQKLEQYCIEVLQNNSVNGWTRPAPNLYPHQWLWDSCFIAIGQRHFDIKRSQKEIKNLFRGQWKNGMVPNIILGEERFNDRLWNSKVSKDSPKKYKTSGITQPPMIAEAVQKIGQKLNKKERLEWYGSVFDELLLFHEWLYRERDPHSEGLVVLVHPWESGLDNNPAWIREMKLNEMPTWIKLVKNLGLSGLFNTLRNRSKYLAPDERIDNIDALVFYSLARRLRRRKYETRLILRHAHLLIEDLAFNSILIRANTVLTEIADEINREIPGWLWERMKKAPHALELLWSEANGQYFSRSFETFELIDEPTIATFLPLYAGTITHKKAKELVELMKSRVWATKYPVPSVPTNSRYFQPKRYWQGPTWINTNWLIAEGLKRYGFMEEANELAQKSLQLIVDHGAYEYFNPLDGQPAGAHPFSWTAALTLDFINQ